MSTPNRDHRNVRAREHVDAAVVAAPQLSFFGSALVVDGWWACVDRPAFFLGGLELFVGALQLFVRGQVSSLGGLHSSFDDSLRATSVSDIRASTRARAAASRLPGRRQTFHCPHAVVPTSARGQLKPGIRAAFLPPDAGAAMVLRQRAWWLSAPRTELGRTARSSPPDFHLTTRIRFGRRPASHRARGISRRLHCAPRGLSPWHCAYPGAGLRSPS